MEYKTYNLEHNRLHIIKTNKFKTISIKINFKTILKKEEKTIRNFISQILLCSSKNYSSKRQLQIESEELYGIDINSKSYRSGNYSVISFSTTFLNEIYTEQGMNKKSINFFKDLILNPDVSNEKFNKISFNLTKNMIEEDINSIKDNPGRYSMVRLYEETAPNTVISYMPDGYLSDLNKITRDSLYKYYKKMLKEDIVDIFVIGDIDINEIKELLNINIGKGKSILEKHFLKLENIRKDVNEVIEKKDINQSKLAISCLFNNLTDFEKKYVLKLYTFILGGSGESKLFKSLRVNNSLCYYINARSSMLDGIITITSGIDKRNYKQAVDLIKKVLEDIKRGNFELEEIEKGKITFINSCKEIYDYPLDLLNVYVSHEYIGNDLIENKIKEIDKVDKNMIINLAKKVNLNTIFLLEGGE